MGSGEPTPDGHRGSRSVGNFSEAYSQARGVIQTEKFAKEWDADRQKVLS